MLPDGPAQAGHFRTARRQSDRHHGRQDPARVAPDSDDAAKVGRLNLYRDQARRQVSASALKDPDSEYRREFHGIDSLPSE